LEALIPLDAVDNPQAETGKARTEERSKKNT